MTETVVYQTETSDMLIPHNMFRSVLRTAPEILREVRDGDSAHAADVYSYFDNVLRFLDAHHGGEDDLVWPLLTKRCPEAAELLARMENQHQAIHDERERSGVLLDAWVETADAGTAGQVASALAALTSEIEAHFAQEEDEILPLASRNMSQEEWGALPGHAMGHFSGDKIWLILGLILEQMTPEQRAFTLTLLPPPAVEMWTSMGNAAFDDFVAKVRRAG